MEIIHNFEMLDLRAFAERMKISRSTVYAWMKQGVLVEGTDYMHRGRILRFTWSHELVQRLMASSRKETQESPTQPERTYSSHPARPGGQINWDYTGGKTC